MTAGLDGGRDRGMTDDSDEQSLARDMIEVRGLEAAAVARDNARRAALAGHATQAKAWIRVLGCVQRQQADRPTRPGA